MIETATKNLATIKEKREDMVLWDVYYILEVEYFNTYNEKCFELMTMVRRIMEFGYSTGRLYKGLVLYVLSKLNSSYQGEYEAHIRDDMALHGEIKGFLS